MTPHLLALPGEIKNRIYEFCVDEEVTVEFTADHRLITLGQWKRKWTMIIFEGHPEKRGGDPKEFPLAKTCRQVRFEILPTLAQLGHNCLHVPLSARFSAQMITPLPQAFMGNVKELRLWKNVPTLKNQTLTHALPTLERLILDFHSQKFAHHFGDADDFREFGYFSDWLWVIDNFPPVLITELKDQVIDIYQREEAYLETT